MAHDFKISPPGVGITSSGGPAETSEASAPAEAAKPAGATTPAQDTASAKDTALADTFELAPRAELSFGKLGGASGADLAIPTPQTSATSPTTDPATRKVPLAQSVKSADYEQYARDNPFAATMARTVGLDATKTQKIVTGLQPGDDVDEFWHQQASRVLSESMYAAYRERADPDHPEEQSQAQKELIRTVQQVTAAGSLIVAGELNPRNLRDGDVIDRVVSEGQLINTKPQGSTILVLEADAEILDYWRQGKSPPADMADDFAERAAQALSPAEAEAEALEADVAPPTVTETKATVEVMTDVARADGTMFFGAFPSSPLSFNLDEPATGDNAASEDAPLTLSSTDLHLVSPGDLELSFGPSPREELLADALQFFLPPPPPPADFIGPRTPEQMAAERWAEGDTSVFARLLYDDFNSNVRTLKPLPRPASLTFSSSFAFGTTTEAAETRQIRAGIRALSSVSSHQHVASASRKDGLSLKDIEQVTEHADVDVRAAKQKEQEKVAQLKREAEKRRGVAASEVVTSEEEAKLYAEAVDEQNEAAKRTDIDDEKHRVTDGDAPRTPLKNWA